MATSLEGVEAVLEGVLELSISRWDKILTVTPIEQALMAVGIHGIGKSEFFTKWHEDHGFAVITLFLGQMADAGDVIGLPDRTEVEFRYKGQVLKQKITEFCPPKWWPRDEDVKLLLFLDEFNRGKQEVYQCIQDMTLNRKLNGLELPAQTRIIAAQNPLDDKYGYQVTEIDPALWDRFNVYGFSPEAKEWIHWAMDNKVHRHIIGFLTKNTVELDPPANGKMGVVYPSRRSWVRLSNILKNHPQILGEDELILLRELAEGIVGSAATSKLFTFLKENFKGLNPGRVVTNWNEEVEEIVKQMDNQSKLAFNAELAIHLEENEKDYFDIAGAKQKEKYAYNIYQYLKTVPREIMADFYDYVGDATTERKKGWPSKLLDCNIQGLVHDFIDVYHGDDSKMSAEPTINPEEHFSEPGIDLEKDDSPFPPSDNPDPFDDPDIQGLLGDS